MHTWIIASPGAITLTSRDDRAFGVEYRRSYPDGSNVPTENAAVHSIRGFATVFEADTSTAIHKLRQTITRNKRVYSLIRIKDRRT